MFCSTSELTTLMIKTIINRKPQIINQFMRSEEGEGWWIPELLGPAMDWEGEGQ
jgi:hypothetical protein